MNIVEFLNEKNLTISCAESFTGGLYANHVTNIPHASKCFMGGLVCYDPSIKINVLGVNPETIEKLGTISKECCTEMVEKCAKLFNSDIAVAFTGNAGPTTSENKPAGLCYVGLCCPKKNLLIVNELNLTGTREEVKEQAVKIIDELIFVLF